MLRLASQSTYLILMSSSSLDRYYWRTPYADMTEPEIVAHLQAAREFAFSDADPTECIQSALAGGSAACCLSWAATKLEPDYIMAGVDEADGTIKVICFLEEVGVVLPKCKHRRQCRRFLSPVQALGFFRQTPLKFLSPNL